VRTVNILIVGLGYAGTRFLRAFGAVTAQARFAYVNRNRGRDDLPYFSNVPTALREFRPDIVVVSVSDGSHARILHELDGYRGFIVCEKPLVRADDDVDRLRRALASTSGFCLDLVERYSPATVALRQFVADHELELVRGHFFWGKDRINDHRVTTGAVSEVIHSLDLIQWICRGEDRLEILEVIGVRSDFSISGPDVLDSVSLNARMGTATVTGYSSFVSITRRREIDFTFLTPDGGLVHANMVFDTPEWDLDRLTVWRPAPGGTEVLLELDTADSVAPAPRWNTIRKLSVLAEDVLRQVQREEQPRQPFPDLETGIQLQLLLNNLERTARCAEPVAYFPGVRSPVTVEVDLERLG
jgi:predicted dehydrogenase